MSAVQRVGELSGLASMIADLVEGNLISDPGRSKLLSGERRRVSIIARDLDVEVSLTLGEGVVLVSETSAEPPHMKIYAESATLLDLPNAKLLGGLPSLFDPTGRAVTKKLLTGSLKVKGMFRIGLLSRVQRLLTVA